MAGTTKNFKQVFQSLKAGDQFSIIFKKTINYGAEPWFENGKTYNGMIVGTGAALKIWRESSGPGTGQKAESIFKDQFETIVNPLLEDYCTIIDCDLSAVRRPASEGGTNIYTNFTSLMNGQNLSADTNSASITSTAGTFALDIQGLAGADPPENWNIAAKKNVRLWKNYPEFITVDSRYEITVPAQQSGLPITEYPDFSSSPDPDQAKNNFQQEIITRGAVDGVQALLSFYNKQCTVEYAERKTKDWVSQGNLHLTAQEMPASPGDPIIFRYSVYSDAFDNIPAKVKDGCLADGDLARSWMTIDQNSLRLIGEGREILQQYDNEIKSFKLQGSKININLEEEINKIDEVVKSTGLLSRFLELRNQGGFGFIRERPIDGIQRDGFKNAFRKIQDGKLRLILGLDSFGKVACARLQGTPKELGVDHLLTPEEKMFLQVESQGSSVPRPGEVGVWLRVGIPMLNSLISERTIGYLFHFLVAAQPPEKTNFIQDARENRDKGFESILPKYTRGPKLIISRTGAPARPRNVDNIRRPLNRTPPPTREEIIDKLLKAETKVDDTSDGAWQAMVNGLDEAAEFIEDAEDIYYKTLNYLGIKQLMYELIACLTEDLPFNLSAEALCKSMFKKLLGEGYAGNFTELVLPLLPKEAQDEFLNQGLAGTIGNIGSPGGPTINSTISALPGRNDPGPGAKGSAFTVWDDTPSGAGDFTNMSYSGPGVTGSEIRKQKQNIDIWIKKIENMLDWEQLCQDLVGLIPDLAGLASGFGSGGRTARPSQMLKGTSSFLSGDYFKQRFGKPPTINFNKLLPTKDYMGILAKQLVLGIEEAVTKELKKYVQEVFQYWIEKCRAEDDPDLDNQSAEETGFNLDSLDTKAAALSTGIPSSAIPQDFNKAVLNVLNAKELCLLLNGKATKPLKSKALNLITSDPEKFGTLSLAVTIDNINEFFVSMATPDTLRACDSLPAPAQRLIQATDLCGVEDPCASQISLINSLREKNIPDEIIQYQCRLDTQRRKDLLEELLDLVNSQDFVNSILADVIPENPCAELYPKDLPFLQHQQRAAVGGVLEPVKIAIDTDLEEYPSLLLYGGTGPASGDIGEETDHLVKPPGSGTDMPSTGTPSATGILTAFPKAIKNLLFGKSETMRNKYKADIFEQSRAFQDRKLGTTPLLGLQGAFKNAGNFTIGSKTTQDEELIGYETVEDPLNDGNFSEVPIYQVYLEHYFSAINNSEAGGNQRRASMISRTSKLASAPNTDDYYFEIAPSSVEFENSQSKIFSINYNKKLSDEDLDFYDVEKPAPGEDSTYFQSYGSGLFEKFLFERLKPLMNVGLLQDNEKQNDVKEELKGRVYNDFFLQMFRLFVNNIGDSELFDPKLLQKIDWTGAVDVDCDGIPIEDYINQTDMLGLNSVIQKINEAYGSMMCRPDTGSDMSSFRTAIFFGVVRLTVRTSIVEYFLKNIFSITQLPAADVFNKEWAIERMVSVVFSNLKQLSGSSRTSGVTYYDSFIKSLQIMSNNEPSLLEDYKNKLQEKINLASEAEDVEEVSRLESLAAKPPPYQIIVSLVQDQLLDVQLSFNSILQKLGPEFSIPENSEKMFLDMIFDNMVKNFIPEPGYSAEMSMNFEGLPSYLQTDVAGGIQGQANVNTAGGPGGMWFDLLPCNNKTTGFTTDGPSGGLVGFFPEDGDEREIPEISQTVRFTGDNIDLYNKYYAYGGFILEPFMAYETKALGQSFIPNMPEQLRSGFITDYPKGNITISTPQEINGVPSDGNYQSDGSNCAVDFNPPSPGAPPASVATKTFERPLGVVNPILFHQWCGSQGLSMDGSDFDGKSLDELLDTKVWKSVTENWLTELYDTLKSDPLTGVVTENVEYPTTPFLDPYAHSGLFPTETVPADAKWGPFWNLARHIRFLSDPSWRVGPNKVGFTYGRDSGVDNKHYIEPSFTEIISDIVIAVEDQPGSTANQQIGKFQYLINQLQDILYKGDATMENIVIPFGYVSKNDAGSDFLPDVSEDRFVQEYAQAGTYVAAYKQKQNPSTKGFGGTGSKVKNWTPPFDLTDLYWGNTTVPINEQYKGPGGKEGHQNFNAKFSDHGSQTGTSGKQSWNTYKNWWRELPEYGTIEDDNVLGQLFNQDQNEQLEALVSSTKLYFFSDHAPVTFEAATIAEGAGFTITEKDTGQQTEISKIDITKRYNSCDTWLLDHMCAVIGIIENTPLAMDGDTNQSFGPNTAGSSDFDQELFEQANDANLFDSIAGIVVTGPLSALLAPFSGPEGGQAIGFRQGAAAELYSRAALIPHPGALGGGAANAQSGIPAAALKYNPEVASPGGPNSYLDTNQIANSSDYWKKEGSTWWLEGQSDYNPTPQNKDYLAWLNRGRELPPGEDPGGAGLYNRWSQTELEKFGMGWLNKSGPGFWKTAKQDPGDGEVYRANMHPASTLAHLYYWRDCLMYIAAMRSKYYKDWLLLGGINGKIGDNFGPFKYGLRLSYLMGEGSSVRGGFSTDPGDGIYTSAAMAGFSDISVASELGAILSEPGNTPLFSDSTSRKLKIGRLDESHHGAYSIPLVEVMVPRPYQWLWLHEIAALNPSISETFEELKAKILASEEFRVLFRECVPIKELIVPMAALFASQTNPTLGRLEQVLNRTKQSLKSLFFALKRGGNFDYVDPDIQKFGGNAGLLKKMSNQVDTSEMPEFPNLFLIALNTVPLIVKGVVETFDPAWLAFGFMKSFGVKLPKPGETIWDPSKDSSGRPITEDDTIFDPTVNIPLTPFPDLKVPYLLPIATNIGIAWAAWLEVTGWKAPRSRRDIKINDKFDDCGNSKYVQIGTEVFEQVPEDEEE